MAERFRFFDSIDGEDERYYTADEFAEYFRQFIRNGIFNGGENLQVGTEGKDMKVFIKPGYAWIEGYLYKIDTESLALEHGTADPEFNRIDRVVIRLDKSLEKRYVRAFILKGIPAEEPVPAKLTRNDNIYEISLAQVEVIAGKSFIESYQITDERVNNEVCGLVTHLFEQVDTTEIFNEWINYLKHKKEDSTSSYNEFVNGLELKLNLFQKTWSDWIEDKILEPSGEFYSEWKMWFNEIKDITNLVTKINFDEHKADYVSHRTKAEKDKLAGIESGARKLANVDDVKQMPLAGGSFTGIAKAHSNTSYTIAQIRNIILSPNDADLALMDNGDIWIKYK